MAEMRLPSPTINRQVRVGKVPSEQILVAVGAVIEDDRGRILLVKHKKERGGYWQGKWICPGGELEFGEEIKEGIKREVKEETNLEIELVRPLVPFDRIVKLACTLSTLTISPS